MPKTTRFQTKFKELFDPTWIQYVEFLQKEFEALGFIVIECAILEPNKIVGPNGRWSEKVMTVRYHNGNRYDDYKLLFSWTAKSFRIKEKNKKDIDWGDNGYSFGYKNYTSAGKLFDLIQKGIV